MNTENVEFFKQTLSAIDRPGMDECLVEVFAWYANRGVPEEGLFSCVVALDIEPLSYDLQIFWVRDFLILQPWGG